MSPKKRKRLTDDFRKDITDDHSYLEKHVLVLYCMYMMLLQLLLLPSAFMYLESGRNGENFRTNGFLFGCGMAIAILFGLLIQLFPLVDWFYQDSFSLHFSVLLLFTGVLPLFAVLGTLFILFRDRTQRWQHSFVPLLYGFWSVYVFVDSSFFPATSGYWGKVFLPLLLVSVLFLMDFLLERLPPSNSILFDDIVRFVIMPLFLFSLCSLTRTLWFYSFPWWCWTVPAAMCVGAAIASRISKYFL